MTIVCDEISSADQQKSPRSWAGDFGDRTVVHVDMDAFFAQIEARDNPEYRGKPLVVGGRRDSRRGVVTTCSYEARRYGIHSAMPIQQAVKLCPHAIFVPTRMERYEAVSRQIRDELDFISPVVESISIDEAFLDMTGSEHFYTCPTQLGQAVKDRIYQATGLTSSVGIAPNKFLAKLASDTQKPDGLVVVPISEVDAFMADMPITALWGVGPKMAARLNKIGIYTVDDVRARTPESFADTTGVRSAHHIHALAYGRDDRPVQSEAAAKSIGRETTFHDDVADGPELRAHLARLAAAVGTRLRRKQLYARTVSVKIRFPDFRTHTKSHTRPHAFRDDDTLYREAIRLLDAFELRRPLRLLGVYVSHFDKQPQASLFGGEGDELTDVLDQLNSRLGKHTVRRGRELSGEPKRLPDKHRDGG